MLRPEFLNRVDEIIIFQQLSRDHIKQIVDLQFAQLKKRLADRRIEVELNDRAKELLVKEGYDPIYGARPLKRAIQRLVLDPLAVKILEGEFKDGDTVVVSAENGAITFSRKPVPAGAA